MAGIPTIYLNFDSIALLEESILLKEALDIDDFPFFPFSSPCPFPFYLNNFNLLNK